MCLPLKHKLQIGKFNLINGKVNLPTETNIVKKKSSVIAVAISHW